MTCLISLEQAQADLRDDSPDAQADIMLKAQMATDIVLDYIERRGPIGGADWTRETVPFLIKAAVMIVLRNLYEDEEPLNAGVQSILRRYRDPAVA